MTCFSPPAVVLSPRYTVSPLRIAVWEAAGFTAHRLRLPYARHEAGSRVFVRPSSCVYDSYTLWFDDGTRLARHWIPAGTFATFFAPA